MAKRNVGRIFLILTFILLWSLLALLLSSIVCSCVENPTATATADDEHDYQYLIIADEEIIARFKYPADRDFFYEKATFEDWATSYRKEDDK